MIRAITTPTWRAIRSRIGKLIPLLADAGYADGECLPLSYKTYKTSRDPFRLRLASRNSLLSSSVA